MTKVDCLRRLCEKITGKKSDGDTVAEILHDMGNDYHNDYSEGLIATGEKWLDGKPIYKLAVKTNLGNLAAEINKYKPDTIVSWYGQAVSTYGNQHPIPSLVAGASAYKMDFMQDNATFDIKIQYGDYFKDEYNAYAIIEFTTRD